MTGAAAPVRAGIAPQVRFARLAPMPPAYPKPWFPMVPVAGRLGTAADAFRPDSRFLRPDVVHTATGGAAIHWALRSAGIGAGDLVAVPAYHCPTMVFPVLAAGARPLFVPIRADLSVSVDALRGRIEGVPRAVLLPHFLGFRQPGLEAIREWCDARGAVLIEDCAHAFYGDPEGFVPGRAGHYAIASTRKFFAGTEGGALVSNAAPLRLALAGRGLREELRAAVDTWQLAARAGSLPWVGQVRTGPIPGELDGPADEAAAREEARPRPADAAELAIGGDPRQGLRVTRALIRCADHVRSASVRRARYRRWQEALATLPGVRPFREGLPETGVPYAFPALLERPQDQYARLKRAGIQVWRWDSLAESGCAVSQRLGLSLIQLPCQQSVDDAGFEALIAAFRTALSST